MLRLFWIACFDWWFDLVHGFGLLWRCLRVVLADWFGGFCGDFGRLFLVV